MQGIYPWCPGVKTRCLYLKCDIATPGNPFAHLGIKRPPVHIQPPPSGTPMVFTGICHKKCPFQWIWPIGMYWIVFLIGSRHISRWFYAYETIYLAVDILFKVKTGATCDKTDKGIQFRPDIFVDFSEMIDRQPSVLIIIGTISI